MKRLLSILISLCVLLSIFPVAAQRSRVEIDFENGDIAGFSMGTIYSGESRGGGDKSLLVEVDPASPFLSAHYRTDQLIRDRRYLVWLYAKLPNDSIHDTIDGGVLYEESYEAENIRDIVINKNDWTPLYTTIEFSSDQSQPMDLYPVFWGFQEEEDTRFLLDELVIEELFAKKIIVNGATSVSIPEEGESDSTAQYTYTIENQLGNDWGFKDGDIIWSLADQYEGVSLTSDGTLNVSPDAQEGEIEIQASYLYAEENDEDNVSGNYTVTLTKEDVVGPVERSRVFFDFEDGEKTGFTAGEIYPEGMEDGNNSLMITTSSTDQTETAHYITYDLKKDRKYLAYTYSKLPMDAEALSIADGVLYEDNHNAAYKRDLVDGNKEVIAVYASSEVVEGEAEAISETEITIGGQNYPAAADLRAYDEENYDDLILEGVKPGDSGTYYLNSAGEVVFARISKTGIQYGYVTKYAMTDRISGTLEIEIFAEKDGWKIYHFNQNVELDGINVKAEDVKEILDRSIQDRGRVVKFIANAQDEITFLDTIVHNEMESEQSMKLVQQDVTTKMDYYQGYNIDNVPYKIWNNTRVLIVPQDESDKENFLFTNNSYFVEKETYTFDLYNVSKMLIADCAVIYTSETVGGVYEDSINVVTKVVNMVNSNGENTAALYVARPVGRSGMETRKLEINASAYRSPETLYTGAVGYDEVTEIRPGDVVRCIYDQTGKVMRIKLYFRYTDPPEPNILNDPAGTDEYGYVTVLEKDPSSNFFVVQSGDNPQQNDNHKRAYLLRVILAYYPERNEVVETDINDINIGETLFFWGNLGHPALTFLVR